MQEYYQANKDKFAEYRKANKDKRAEYNREYQKENKDKIAEYRQANKDKFAEYKREYSQANKDNISEQRKAYRRANKDKIAEWHREHYHQNKDKIAEYKQANKDKIAEREREYFQNNINARLARNLRIRVINALKRISKSAATIELIGCTIEELKEHLEAQFTEGMTWDNYNFYGWHVDHIRPCASYDLTDPEQQKLCFHYSNLQPLWAEDNLSKHAKYAEG